jgi:tetratricopeptide (TPR) repeat protein
MKAKWAYLAFAAITLGLGGCSSIFHNSKHSARGVSDPSMDQANLADYFAGRIALGKQMLDAKNYGGALATFRQARFDPRYAAEAYNGMGVAYARLGREDLAERFFATALQQEPTNAKFAANVQRIHARSEQAHELQLAASANRQALELAKLTTVQVMKTDRATLRVAPTNAQLVRVSSHEFRLVDQATIPRKTLASSTAPRSDSAHEPSHPAHVSFASNDRYQKSITAKISARAAEYPVRVRLGQ